MAEEKRQFKRLKGKDGAFAAFIGSDDLFNLGQIVDISLGGVCVQYLSTSDQQAEHYGIKIFGSNGRFIHIQKIGCKIVYDHEIVGSSWQQLRTRRCGVQFEDLTIRQKSLLHDFIDHFTYDDTSYTGRPLDNS